MMDMGQVVQAFAAQMCASVQDVVQQIEPLDGRDVDNHQARTARLVGDTANWLVGLTPDDIQTLESGWEYLPFDQWFNGDGYDATAACAMAHERIFAGLRIARDQHIDGYQLIHATGLYLSDMDDHKAGWLAEQAANLLFAGGLQ